MKRLLMIAAAVLLFSGGTGLAAVPDTVMPDVAKEKGCLSCHDGIEKFSEGDMQKDIEKFGATFGDAAGCTVCHGGNAQGLTKDEAHGGAAAELTRRGGPDAFYPDPGALWISDKACGQCHTGYEERLEKAPMNTEAGKIQGNFWSWGMANETGYKHVYGNYDIVDEDGPVPQIGTDAYKKYVTKYAKTHTDQVPKKLKQVPPMGEAEVAQLAEKPNLAGITYTRQECQRCHVGVRGRERRADYRGSGVCRATCPIPTRASTLTASQAEMVGGLDRGASLAAGTAGQFCGEAYGEATAQGCDGGWVMPLWPYRRRLGVGNPWERQVF